MKEQYNWGIIGPGNIARQFASALKYTEKGKLLSVGSRSLSRAEEFAAIYKAERWYGNYQQLIDDKDIDVIYIATPHHLHYELTKKCFEGGKHVLCEKPVTLNHAEYSTLTKISKDKSLFYMDALWTRFLPHINSLLEIISTGKIGEIKFLQADFGFKAAYNPEGRLFNPKLGGGALMDIGIYPVFLSLLILGKPDEVYVTVSKADTEVDESSGLVFYYRNGCIANLFSSFRVNTDTSAEIAGTGGKIKIQRNFFAPASFRLSLEGERDSHHEFSVKHNGYEYEAEEVMNCLDKGLIESPLLPHSFTSDLMQILDEIREKAGIRYPADKK